VLRQQMRLKRWIPRGGGLEQNLPLLAVAHLTEVPIHRLHRTYHLCACGEP